MPNSALESRIIGERLGFISKTVVDWMRAWRRSVQLSGGGGGGTFGREGWLSCGLFEASRSRSTLRAVRGIGLEWAVVVQRAQRQ